MHAHMRAGEERGRCLASERSDPGLVGNEASDTLLPQRRNEQSGRAVHNNY